MWSTARYTFGLSDAEFWRLTLWQFYELSKRHDEEVQRFDFHFGVVASTIANTSRDPKKRRKPFEPKDFMPDREPKRRVKKTPKALHDYWKANVLTAFRVIKKEAH